MTKNEYEALLQFVYLAPVGLVQTAMDGDIVMINPVSAKLLVPISRDGALVNLFSALEPVLPDLRQICASFQQPFGHVCDGLRIQVSAGVPSKTDPQFLSLTIVKLDENRLMAVLGDISVQVKNERKLKQNEAWFNAILTGISDYALVRLDSHGNVEEWNTSIGRVTGFTREATLGQPYSIFYPVDAITSDGLQDRLRDAESNGWSLDEGYCLNSDGSQFWASSMIMPLHEPEGPSGSRSGCGTGANEASYCMVMRDISDKRDVNEKYRIANSCDFLTGLANRRTFFEAAEIEIERMKRSPRTTSLIIFDADNFKNINDRFGHSAGDAVLRHFAVVLQETFRRVDVIARVGGEEFAVMLPSTNLENAGLVAERVRTLIHSQVVELDGLKISYTVSAGVASMDNGNVGLDDLMKRADLALYKAKAEGRNRITHWTATLSRSDEDNFSDSIK